MRPFGWLPDYPQWSRRPISDSCELQNLETRRHRNEVVQRIDDYILSIDLPARSHDNDDDDNDNTESKSLPLWTNEDNLDTPIENLWLAHRFPGKISLDLNPNLDPKLLRTKYDETLSNHGPLSLFPKQVLAKVSSGLEPHVYLDYLKPLLITPADVDEKYNCDHNSDASNFVETIRQLDDGMRPFTDVLYEYKIRETQLQIILGIEVLALDPKLETSLDHHFDRLCIWQAVRGPADLVSDFCSTVIMPFFKNKTPRKVKQLMRINKGTLKSRSKSSKNSISRSSSAIPLSKLPSLPSTPSPSSLPLTGLAKALHMQNLSATLNNPDGAKDQSVPPPNSKRRTPSEHSAYRSVSHPVYKQESLQSHFEVKFKKARISKQRSVRSKVIYTDLPPASKIDVDSKPVEPESQRLEPESRAPEIEDDINSSTDSDSN